MARLALTTLVAAAALQGATALLGQPRIGPLGKLAEDLASERHGTDLSVPQLRRDLGNCQYDTSDGDRERFCEPSQSASAAPDNGCGCKEICHVWGDPHLAPFYSICAAHVMNDVGKYTLWEVPSMTNVDDSSIEREKIGVYADVRKGGSNVWVKAITMVGGFDSVDAPSATLSQVTIDSDEVCIDKSDLGDNGYRIVFSVDVPSDLNIASGDVTADIRATVTITCHKRYGHFSLDTNIAVDSIEIIQTAGVPESTMMFSNDFGLCTDPIDKPRCHRESHIKKAYDKMDGRECRCNAQCSVFGDPNVYDFFTEQRKRKNDHKTGRSFRIPKERDMPGAAFHPGRVLYEFSDKFAVYATMNDCEHVKEITVLVNNRIANEVDFLAESECRPEAFLDEPRVLSLSDFTVFTYSAEELCTTDEDFQAGSRKSILFPQAYDTQDAWLTDVLGGVDLGFYGGLDENDPYVRPYTAAEISRQSTLQSCPIEIVPVGGDVSRRFNSSEIYDAQILKFYDMGSVSVTMKCHRTKAKKKKNRRKFFNVCIQRSNVKESNTHFNQFIPDTSSFFEAERAALSSGHCALGSTEIDFSSLRVTGSEHRADRHFNYFTVEQDDAK